MPNKKGRIIDGQGYKIGADVLSPKELKQELPLTDYQSNIWFSKINEIKNVLSGKDDRLLVTLGPCSADLKGPVLEYIDHLSELQKEVPNFLIIPRVYTVKPRTTGVGYKGKSIYPDPNGEANPSEGVRSVRRLHLEVLSKGFVPADEMVTPDNYNYLDDIIGLVAIGARTCSSPHHQEVASGAVCPIGVKNAIEGGIGAMINSIKSIQSSHTYIGRNPQNGYDRPVTLITTGNPHAYGILRGANLDAGGYAPNYNYESLLFAINGLEKAGVKNPALVVDTNHGNSGKKHLEQMRIMRSVLTDMIENETIFNGVKGFLIESYLKDGSQTVKSGERYEPGISITDPCLGIEKTKIGILQAHDLYSKAIEKYH